MQRPWRSALAGVWIASASLAVACGSGSTPANQGVAQAPPHAADVPAVSAPRPVETRPRIVALGDSLTAGLGLPIDRAYPALLQARLDQHGLDYEVVNAGVSGDTSAGGLRRADWVLDGDVRVLIVALGGNDGLRGLPPEALRENLSAIIERGRARGAAVILAGMEAPPNLGSGYTNSFRNVYTSLADEYGVPFIPFLLDGVAGLAHLNQPDGIHPNAEGARIVADNVWNVLRPLLGGPGAEGDAAAARAAGSGRS